ncbi:ATP-binding protein [Pelobium sp.]|nr:ATP-binding protein [Pelobium sp.]MDA9555523.1 ATP-binding protein [Pelobium sp.]
MQISTTEILTYVVLISLIFIIAPAFIILFLLSYNRRKKRHQEEKIMLQKEFKNELLLTQMEVKEQTLKTVAHDLHDNIGQVLSLIIMTLSTLEITDDLKANQKLRYVEELTSRTIREVKMLSKLLHGEDLLTNGLSKAIEVELEWLSKSERFQIDYEHIRFVESPAVSRDSLIIFFRLFQEVINNIIQHSAATAITIKLENQEQNIQLTVEDNGKGFDIDKIQQQNKGMGLNNMNRRAAFIHGSVTFASEKDKGTKVIIQIPYNNHEK